ARRDTDEAPLMALIFIVSKGIVNTNNKKTQRTIFGLVLARTRIYVTFLGRVEERVVSRTRPVSVCRIIEESCICVCMLRSSLSSSEESSYNITRRKMIHNCNSISIYWRNTFSFAFLSFLNLSEPNREMMKLK